MLIVYVKIQHDTININCMYPVIMYVCSLISHTYPLRVPEKYSKKSVNINENN